MSVQRRAKQPTLVASLHPESILLGEEKRVEDLSSPIDLDGLVPGTGDWEVEIGFGKGRYLLQRAQECPDRRFLGVEIVTRYYRMGAKRARHHELPNVAFFRAEALYLLSTALPKKFASAIHVYFPDPWPKARHHKRRLFEVDTVDLLLDALKPEGKLVFATDFVKYGELVQEILDGHPRLKITNFEAWPEGPRTNYEAKYVVEGRPIRRLEAELREVTVPSSVSNVHPEGRKSLLVGPGPPVSPTEGSPTEGPPEGVSQDGELPLKGPASEQAGA